MKTEVIRARIPVTLKKDFEAAAATHGWNLSQGIRQLMKQYYKFLILEMLII